MATHGREEHKSARWRMNTALFWKAGRTCRERGSRCTPPRVEERAEGATRKQTRKTSEVSGTQKGTTAKRVSPVSSKILNASQGLAERGSRVCRAKGGLYFILFPFSVG